MYYHVIVKTTYIINGKPECCYELDCEKIEDIIECIVTPYNKQEKIYIDGRYLDYQYIKSLKIKKSDKPLSYLVGLAKSTFPERMSFFDIKLTIVNKDEYVTDITKETIRSIGEIITKTASNDLSKRNEKNNKIFIVHGRDNDAKEETARFIENLGFEAIILHEQANSGNTIIEKIEEHTNVDFAIVLYTPCDVGGLSGANEQKSRARQNVIFEHGYLIGKLSRSKVCALVKGDIETPNDISGVVYIPFDNHDGWRLKIAKELKKAGFPVNLDNFLGK
jgi:predicted nucleotide-binding protein